MARLGPPPAPEPPRNPCFLKRMQDNDPELYADVIEALQQPRLWPNKELAAQCGIGKEAIRLHRAGECGCCAYYNIPAALVAA